MKKILSFLVAFIVLFSTTIVLAYDHKVAPSKQPPKGLNPKDVPQFIVFGSDDNAFSGLDEYYGGSLFLLDTFNSRVNPIGKVDQNPTTYDGTPTSFSMYVTSKFISPGAPESSVNNKKIWRRILESGNEIGNHTHNHNSGLQFTTQQWEREFDLWNEAVAKPYDPIELQPNPNTGIGIKEKQIFGFRTPYLEYNNNVFKVIRQKGYVYDCSIEEGYQLDQDGTNNFWPYTLDNGSPGDVRMSELWGYRLPIDPQPGLWEIPVYTFIIPPDSECAKYGIEPGFRQRKAGLFQLYNPEEGKVTGFDWNIFSQLKMTKAEALATLKYTLDLKLNSNRAPMTVGLHSDMYSPKYGESLPHISDKERREVLTEFVDYALSKKEVRIVSAEKLIEWLKNPQALR